MFDAPFRGSVAVAGGLVTAKQLRGPRFRRLFQDVFVGAHVEVGLAVRARAASVLVSPSGVLGGWSAAELLAASCGPADAPAEVVVTTRRRGQPGLRVRHEVLPADEVTCVDGVLVTTPARTAYDLARRSPMVEAVVAVDALSHVHPFTASVVMTLNSPHLGGTGSGQLPTVLRLASPMAESPMETRIRLALVFAGLSPPVLQHPVGRYRLDMAYPRVQLGVEYDGRDHLQPGRVLRDLDRQAWLSTEGWRILRFPARVVLQQPWQIAAAVRRALG